LNQIAHTYNGNLHDAAETDSMLGVVSRSLLKAHDAVCTVLAWGKKYPET